MPVERFPAPAMNGFALERLGAADVRSPCQARATPLAPLLAELLAPLAGWGRLHVALVNRAAEVSCDIEAASVHVSRNAVRIESARCVVALAAQGMPSCCLYEDAADPDVGAALVWFDAGGHPLGGIFLPREASTDAARLHLAGYALSDAGPAPRPSRSPDMLTFVGQGLPGDVIARGDSAAELALTAILGTCRAGEFLLGFAGPGATARYRGPLSRNGFSEGGPWASHDGCLVRVRTDRVQEVALVLARNADGLQLTDADGGTVTLAAQGEAAGRWVADILRDVA